MVDVDRLQRLQALVARATAAPTVEGVARVLFDEGMVVVGSVYGGLWLVSDRVLEPVHVLAPSGDEIRVSVDLDGDSPLASCVRGREAIWIGDVAEFERRFPASFARYRPSVGCVCLPLLVGERAIGGAVFAFEGTRTFTEPERAALELLARQCAQTIERLRLVEAEHAARLCAERVAERMRRLGAAAARLSAARGQDEVARILIDECIAMFGATAAALWLRSGDELNMVAQLGASRASVEATSRIALDDRGPLGSAMRGRKSVWLASRATAAADGYPINDARWHGIGALVILPLVARDELVGAIGMSFAESRSFAPGERELAETFALHAALSLARELEHASERLLGEVTNAVSGTLDRQTVLERLADLSVERFADWCIIDIERDGVLERRVVAYARPEDATRAAVLRDVKPRAQQSIARVMQTRQHVLVPVVTDEMIERVATTPAHAAALREIGVRSFLCAPMMVGGRAIGGITWGSCERAFDERDVALAMRIAGDAAAAYENARLYAAEAAAARRLAKHQELTAALSSARTPLEVCQATAQKSVEALGACAAMIWLRSPDGKLKLAGAAAPPEWAAQWAVLPSDPTTPASRVIATGETIVVENARDYEERSSATYAYALKADRVNAFITLPLTIGGVRTGVFALSFEGSHRFTKDERLFVAAIARSCEQAIERAQLYVNEAKARSDAEAVGRAKDTFVAMAGHALRNRIAPIVSALEVMRLNNLRESMVEREIIERQVHELDGLVDELLSIARGTALDAGIPKPKKFPRGSGLEPVETSTRSLRVLVVEDNVDMATMLGNLLSMLGHEPLIAHDGAAALACVERDRPHLAFCDLGLPGMDGFEIVRRLREHPGFADVPVIALTGYDQASDRNATREAGFVEHVVKPVDLEQLRSIVDRFS